MMLSSHHRAQQQPTTCVAASAAMVAASWGRPDLDEAAMILRWGEPPFPLTRLAEPPLHLPHGIGPQGDPQTFLEVRLLGGEQGLVTVMRGPMAAWANTERLMPQAPHGSLYPEALSAHAQWNSTRLPSHTLILLELLDSETLLALDPWFKPAVMPLQIELELFVRRLWNFDWYPIPPHPPQPLPAP